MSDAAAIAAKMPLNAKQVVRLLDGNYRPAPRAISRQQVAHYATYCSELIESEHRAGKMHYRLKPLGQQVKAILQEQPQ